MGDPIKELQALARNSFSGMANDVTPEKRQSAIQLLKRALGDIPIPEPLKLLFPPFIARDPSDTRHAYRQTVRTDQSSHPQAGMVEILGRHAYPGAMSALQSLQVADFPSGSDTMGKTYPSTGAISINSNMPDLDLGEMMSTLRHELGHSRGLEDYGDPSAYDLSFAGKTLNKNIRLPSK